MFDIRKIGRFIIYLACWCTVRFLRPFQENQVVRKRLYVIMQAVVILASFIMIVPQNLYHTISGENFVTYIGVGNCDIRLDIQQTEQIGEKTADIGSYMESDPEIADYALFVSKIFPIRLDNGEPENLKVELGDHTVFPLQYVQGRLPADKNEIALLDIYADELNKHVGEQITLMASNGEKLSAAAISALGATTFQFTVNPLATYVVSPLILVASGLLAAIWGTVHAGDVKLCQSIKE